MSAVDIPVSQQYVSSRVTWMRFRQAVKAIIVSEPSSCQKRIFAIHISRISPCLALVARNRIVADFAQSSLRVHAEEFLSRLVREMASRHFSIIPYFKKLFIFSQCGGAGVEGQGRSVKPLSGRALSCPGAGHLLSRSTLCPSSTPLLTRRRRRSCPLVRSDRSVGGGGLCDDEGVFLSEKCAGYGPTI